MIKDEHGNLLPDTISKVIREEQKDANKKRRDKDQKVPEVKKDDGKKEKEIDFKEKSLKAKENGI